MVNTAYLSIGSNIGDRKKNLELAIEKLNQVAQVSRLSHIYETEPVGGVKQDDFLNMAIQVKTSKSAYELLDDLHAIEKALKRKRIIHWGPRTIDLDILFFNNDHVSSPELTIPHPEIPNRRFVLIPMLEVSQDDPKLHQAIQALLDATSDKNMVIIYDSGSENIEPTQN
ncbi:2-amino-4-hydroxy-6-hydroxymethyldihydropteridine diphosphokinase [Pediococcus acidilactici]|nr:2-amino-4-hydroxy-6-hydroxymethyldihydropteridine diphosphokinase [Pediococcus acidilactici]